MARDLRAWLLGAALVLVSPLAGCSATSGDEGTPGDEDDLTSLTARQRTLTFEGIVYVPAGSNDEAILGAARTQTQTAFGALLASKVAVRTREVQNVDVASLKKRD